MGPGLVHPVWIAKWAGTRIKRACRRVRQRSVPLAWSGGCQWVCGVWTLIAPPAKRGRTVVGSIRRRPVSHRTLALLGRIAQDGRAFLPRPRVLCAVLVSPRRRVTQGTSAKRARLGGTSSCRDRRFACVTRADRASGSSALRRSASGASPALRASTRTLPRKLRARSVSGGDTRRTSVGMGVWERFVGQA